MPRKYRLPQLIKLPHPPGHKINSIPPNPPPFAVMYDDVTLPTPHHPRGNADPADSFPTVHPMDEVNLNLGAYPVCGPIGSIFDSRSPSQRQGPPNPLQSWGAVLSWTPVTTSHSSQEVLRGESSFDISSTTYTPYPDSFFDSNPEPARRGTSEPAFPYPLLSRVVHTGTGNYIFGMPELERQSVLGVTHIDRSQSESSSAVFYHGPSLTTWFGPPHTSPSTDHIDRSFLGLVSDPLRHNSSPKLDVTEDGRTTPGSWTSDITSTAAYAATVPFLLLPVPVGLLKIPQQPYTPRTADKSFLRLPGVTFSVERVPGFNMQRAFDRVFTGLDGRDDPVLENANGPVSCRLLFPGYPSNAQSNQIAVRNWRKDPSPIIKSKLAYEIAKRVQQYLDTLVAIPICQSTDPKWAVGQGHMKLEKMYLVRVSWVSKGSLQPEIWVDTHDS